MNELQTHVIAFPMGVMWLYPLIWLAIIVFVIVIAWRVMRALERIAAAMEGRTGDYGGPRDITS